MADHSPAGPVDMGAPMDYPEHEKTYRLFVGLAKYGTLFTVALLTAMAFAFFTSAGFFSGLILFIVMTLVGIYLLRRAPDHVA
jgi:hypothetical protein